MLNNDDKDFSAYIFVAFFFDFSNRFYIFLFSANNPVDKKRLGILVLLLRKLGHKTVI